MKLHIPLRVTWYLQILRRAKSAEALPFGSGSTLLTIAQGIRSIAFIHPD